jgi:hypothetical protein
MSGVAAMRKSERTAINQPAPRKEMPDLGLRKIFGRR